jgi:hypothetical protein
MRTKEKRREEKRGQKIKKKMSKKGKLARTHTRKVMLMMSKTLKSSVEQKK